MKRLVALVALTGVLAALPACGKKEEFRDEVQRVIRRTQLLSGVMKYFDERADSEVAVDVRFADDFKYQARVKLGDTFAYDEYVVDDVLAVRLREPGVLQRLADPGRMAAADLETEIEGVTVPQALQAKRWVIDVGAAPYLSVGQIDETKLGIDPVFDAMTALDYVDAAVTKAEAIQRFDPDSLDPAYNESEDTFPAPADGSGVTRYDLRRPRLPPPAGGALSGRAEATFPRTEHFRKMAIYVKDDRVFQVREAIEIRGKQVEDFTRYFRLLLKENEASAEVQREFDRNLARTPAAQRGRFLLTFLSEGLRSFGEPPILMRVMNLEFPEGSLGTEIDVALPAEGVVKGELDFLHLSAAAKAPVDAGTRPGGGAEGTEGAGTNPEGAGAEGAGTEGTEAEGGDGATEEPAPSG